MMCRGKIIFFLAVLTATRLVALPPISETEALQLPTAARLTALMAAAQREGWPAQAPVLRAAAEKAYGRDKLAAAEGWFQLYRWASLFGVSDVQAASHWEKAMLAAHLIHPNLPRSMPVKGQPLAGSMLPELQLWILGNPAFSDEFFSLVTQVDFLPRVFQILSQLHFRDPEKFKVYANLALAIALVYDVPPPPNWPHGQVSVAALARKLPPPLDAFIWWIKQDELGKTYHRLPHLGADELKFVVDITAPFSELEWSQEVAAYPLNALDRAYTMVRYDNDRVQRNQFNWPDTPYTLDALLGAGGICVDQSYFAAHVGKARGVPTLLFRGRGTESRHAWFGFLDGNQKWQLDAGRYAEQRFVTGYAQDPQTWRDISDHELKFLSARFRALPSFRSSRIHAEFATDYLNSKQAAAAEKSARKSVSLERRNQRGWEVLLAAGQALGRDAKQQEDVLREAAQAFKSYPDIAAIYLNRATESMRTRGDPAGNDAEQKQLAKRNQRGRDDLRMLEARQTLVRTFATQPIEEQVRVYQELIATHGATGGIGFFDQIVLVFVEHLVRLQQPAEASKAVEAARQGLKVRPGTQLARDFDRLAQQIKATP